MKTKILLCAAFIAAALTGSAQTYHPGKIWVIVNDSTIIPEEGRASKNAAFAGVLADFGIQNVTKPMSFAKTPALRRLVELNTTSSEEDLFEVLNTLNNSDHLFLSVEKCPVPQTMYDPSDYMWYLTTLDPTTWHWNLKKMQADLAWDITKGCPNVKVAITDDGVDLNHPDLIGKIYPPQPFHSGGAMYVGGHGTAVASFIGAETADTGQPSNGQLASVGYNTRVMVDYMGTPNCVYASSVLGAQIISLSWFWSCTPSTSDLLAEQEILGNGTTIIKAAANGFGHCGGNRVYPFSGLEDPRTIVVSSTGKDDKHFDTYGTGGGTHSHYKEVDLCAPGYGVIGAIPTTDANGNPNAWPYMAIGGTSFATPQVAGVAALMYCVNPCLTSVVCQDILKNTTDPIVDAASYPGKVGTGRVNAFKAVKAAQGMNHNTLDLYMKDRPEDFGYGIWSNFPYHWQADRDKSPDVWVRNQPDGLTNQVNQNPHYSSAQPVYVYVRVWNKSCDQSFGQGKVKLYWTKASTNSSWTLGYWDGSYDPTIGNAIGTQNIPNLQPGESTILQFQWNILDPTIYQNWSTCLMARIDNISPDPIVSYPNNLADEVFFNNNVAMRNVTVLNSTPVIDPNNPNNPSGFVSIKDMTRGSFMYIGNVDKDVSKTYNIRFGLPVDEAGPSIIEHGEVHVIVDDRGWEIMESAVAAHVAAGNIRIIGSNHFMLIKDDVTFSNLDFPAEIRSQIFVGFNFLAEDAAENNTYLYQVSQTYMDSVELPTGTENFVVEKLERTPFYADAGSDRTIHSGESATLHALDIGEPAAYAWYAADGSFIQSGTEITVSPASTTEYCLEVISDVDGYKDYACVNVNVKQFWIEQLLPNPADVSTVVSYYVGASGAQLSVYNQTGTLMKSFALAQNSTSQEIDVTDYTPGLYNMVLEVNGTTIDSKILMVQ